MILTESVITCPQCGVQRIEQLPRDTCQFFMNARAVGRHFALGLVTAVCIARTGRFRVRRFKSSERTRTHDCHERGVQKMCLPDISPEG